MDKFGIHITSDDALSDFSVESNKKTVLLRGWQSRAIKYFFGEANGVAMFTVSTGAGKSFCAIKILKQLIDTNPNIRCLIIVPKNVILEDTWYTELRNAGFCFSDIGAYYGKVKDYAKITLTNIQMVDRVLLELFDFCIMDEVHNMGTDRLLKVVRYPFKYKLGLSATPERIDMKHMQLYEYFNHNVFEYDAGEALTDGVLNPFIFTNISVDLDTDTRAQYNIITNDINSFYIKFGSYTRIMRTAKEEVKAGLLGLLNKRKDMVNNYNKKFEVVKSIVEKHKNDKIIIFNEFNKSTGSLYWYLLDVGVKSGIVHSGVKPEERDRILQDFRDDKINILLTSKVLDEGFNLPKIDTAIIMAGNSTARQTIQRMGRVLRKKDKDSALYQIYCNDTIEEDNALKRAKLFKELAISTNNMQYNSITNKLQKQ